MRAYKELADIWTAIHDGSLTMEAMKKMMDMMLQIVDCGAMA